MELVLLKKDLFAEKESFCVGDKNIRALQGYFKMSEKELKRTVETAENLWDMIFRISNLDESFRAHIRFDFIPQFLGVPQKTENGYYLGNLVIKDTYEINTHSPECMSCDALFEESFPEIARHTPSATRQLAKGLKKIYGKEKISMVKGSAVTRDTWINPLKKILKEEGVDVELISPEKAKEKQPSLLWRWGNIDFSGEYGEFESGFQEWLFEAQKEISVFNTVLKKEDDPASKGFLKKSDEIILRTDDDLKKALSLEKDDCVLKPLLGTSGKGIVFGEKVSKSDFDKAVEEAYKKRGYGVFRKNLLPKINLNGSDFCFTMDFLPSFFVVGSKLEYLYTVVRMEPWESYRKNLLINVLQGGGYGGTVAIENKREDFSNEKKQPF